MDLWWIIDMIIAILYMVVSIWGGVDNAGVGSIGSGGDMSRAFRIILIVVISLFIILTPPIGALAPYFKFLVGPGAAVMIIILACFFLGGFTFTGFCRGSGFGCFETIVGIIGVVVGIIQLTLGGKMNVQLGGKK
ncbi:Transmembrane domain-containing protein [Spironucleus salmonicida]|uniref:Transmembrane domain-containing protein n=1 Tax=Spironucleus salmonicida TaxID=348837 RepID=V6LTV4_9EUKA|nr:Transmembrane domain-containing protein [Spironucleus salmonicida]|eukprot:EST48092.1 Transmembrane domain-containing protein [Spironucleus salmonicida]